ncbi:T9SS type A sorting domain-containing protein, partial [Flavobacteriales bacterium]|nr:T9SS type A sorting domain-containing protein [Flavobacteriales bacterium]
PNPAKEYLTIKGLSEIASYSISDINGKLIQNGTAFNNINLENITKGFYFLTIGNTISKKLIVE